MFLVIVSIVEELISMNIGNTIDGYVLMNGSGFFLSAFLGLVTLIVYAISIFFFLASLALSARCLHDQDKSAWWLLLMLIPLIGAIVLLVFCCLKGTQGANRFGEDPLATEN